jgi:hypothetical protein
MLRKCVLTIEQLSSDKVNSDDLGDLGDGSICVSQVSEHLHFEANVTDETDSYSGRYCLENRCDKLTEGNVVITVDVEHPEVLCGLLGV